MSCFGLKATTQIAQSIGTRSVAQVQSFKQRYSKCHPLWAIQHSVPQRTDTREKATQSSPSISLCSSRSLNTRGLTGSPMSLQSDTQLEPEELRSLNHQPSTNPLLAKADRAVRTLRSRNVQLANSPVLSTSYTADPPSPPEGDHQEHTISLIPTSVANNPNYTEREYHQGVGMQPPATTRNNAAHSSRRFEYLCQRSGKKSRRHRRKEGSRVTFPHPLLNKGATEMTQSSMGKDRGVGNLMG